MHLCNNNLNTYYLCMTTSVMISRYQLIGNIICGTVLSGIYTSYILSICNVAVKRMQLKVGQSSYPTQRFATKATMILHFSYSILLKPFNIFSHLTNLVPNLHSYQRTNSFWCTNRKNTILTELLPPSYLFDAHPASFLLVHQLFNCWKLLQTPHLRHFWTLNHHSAYLSLLLPPIILVVRSQNSFKTRVDWLMSSTLASFKTRRHFISICWEYNPSIYPVVPKTFWQLILPSFTCCWLSRFSTACILVQSN